MKAGLTLVEMAQELQRQTTAKKDYIVPTEVLTLTDTGTLTFENEDPQAFAVTDHAHSQIAQRLNIPKKYYDRMRTEAPQLLANNVNHWFTDHPERRMIRTLDGQARAFLSDRYRRLDNAALMEAVLPILSEFGDGLQIKSVGLTGQRLYLKAVNQRLELEVAKGDVVQSGICISNSEIGLGSLKVEPLIYRLVCTNGMIAQDYSRKRYHVGRAAADTESAYELFSDATLEADDRAFFLKVQDTVRATVDEAKFALIVGQLRETTERKIEGNPAKTVEILSDRLSLNQSESGGVLEHLIKGGDLSQWGLLNAVTRTAQDVESYDRATELEAMGSRVMSLPAAAWREMAG